MALHEFTTGSSVYVSAFFTDPLNDEAPIDPTTVTLVVTAPDGSDTTVAPGDIDHVGTGDYEYVLLLAQEGTYRWKFTGTLNSRVKVINGSCDSVDR